MKYAHCSFPFKFLSAAPGCFALETGYANVTSTVNSYDEVYEFVSQLSKTLRIETELFWKKGINTSNTPGTCFSRESDSNFVVSIAYPDR